MFSAGGLIEGTCLLRALRSRWELPVWETSLELGQTPNTLLVKAIASLLRFLGRKTKCHFVIKKKHTFKNLLPSLIHQRSTPLMKYLSHLFLSPGILPPNHSMAYPFKSQLSHHLLVTEKLFCLPYLHVLPPTIIMHSITCFIFFWNYLINGLLPPTGMSTAPEQKLSSL